MFEDAIRAPEFLMYFLRNSPKIENKLETANGMTIHLHVIQKKIDFYKSI